MQTTIRLSFSVLKSRFRTRNPTARMGAGLLGGRLLGGSLLFGSLVGLLGGCSDVVTFSKDFHDDGMKLYAEKDYANAAGAFNGATRQVPNDYVDYYYLADCYAQQGLYQQAIQSYRACYQIMSVDAFGKQDNKLHDQVLNGWAAAVAKSDSRDSETNTVEARAHQEQKPDDYLLLARIYNLRGDPDSAIGAYSHATMIDPQNFAIAKEYGLYLERMGQNEKAVAPLRQAYSLNSSDPAVTAALRRTGVVPGPSIQDQNALAKPLIPAGPLPEVDLSKIVPGGGGSGTAVPAASQQPPQD